MNVSRFESYYNAVQYIRFKRRLLQKHKSLSQHRLINIQISDITNPDFQIKQSMIDESPEISTKIDTNKYQLVPQYGYTHFSDIFLAEREILDKEFSQTYGSNFTDEIVEFADKQVTIEARIQDTTVPYDTENIKNNLLSSTTWVELLYAEYALCKMAENEFAEFATDNASKKDLIKDLHELSVEIIAWYCDTNEQYVKLVLSGRVDANISDALRTEVLDAYNNNCVLCKRSSNLQVHHIEPVSNGGSSEKENLCVLCHDCHYNIIHDEDTKSVSYDDPEAFKKQIQ